MSVQANRVAQRLTCGTNSRTRNLFPLFSSNEGIDCTLRLNTEYTCIANGGQTASVSYRHHPPLRIKI